jgi:hypothetical protein
LASTIATDHIVQQSVLFPDIVADRDCDALQRGDLLCQLIDHVVIVLLQVVVVAYGPLHRHLSLSSAEGILGGGVAQANVKRHPRRMEIVV